MRLAAALTLVGLVAVARADQVTVPLAVDFPVLRAALDRQLHVTPGGSAVLWGSSGGCRSLTVRELQVGPRDGRLRLTVRGAARVGFGLFGVCVAPVSWSGYLETLSTPVIGRDWRLRLGDLDSHLFDPQWRQTTVANRLWEVVKGRVESEFADFAFDLAPPLDEVKALVRASVEPARTGPILNVLETLRPLDAHVDEEGVKVRVAADVPPAAPGVRAPEPAFGPTELAKWQAALESWDGFLVFVIKDLGAVDADPRVRDELLDLLLASRHHLLAALASGPETGVDPVRQLFLEAWERLRHIVREAAVLEGTRDRALRYVAFLTAGDALAALDAAAPSLGLEISADGLRRLARMLEPEYVGDPVAYSDAPDEVLRRLFDFHEPPVGVVAPEPDAWWPIAPRTAWATAPPCEELSRITASLDRHVPERAALGTYRANVARLLALVAERSMDVNAIDQGVAELYRHLVATTAWQESCWRQFVERDGRVTYLLSTSDDIGIMQVNRRVWRGFFELPKLEWDIAYNAGAGAEILAHLLTRYGLREGRTRFENAARATYAAYNGGPDAYRRYRLGNVPRAQRAIDRAFWSKYQVMAAGEALDYVLCVENWGRPPTRDRLSSVSPGSIPKRCTSSRRSRATPRIASRHASIASRPRASWV